MNNSVFQTFEATASKHPDKIAIVDKKYQITYKELELRARTIGSFIYSTFNNNPTVILLDRSYIIPTLILAHLYISKNYIILDSGMPESRLEKIFSTIGNFNIITDKKNYDQVKDYASTYLVNDFIDINHPITKESCKDSVCYTLFTSGSTGVPKGVEIPVSAFQDLIDSLDDHFCFDNSSRNGFVSSFYFDISVFDLAIMIGYGVTLDIIPNMYSSFPKSLVKYLNKNKITITCWVPSIYATLMQVDIFKTQKIEFLKYATFIGEVMHPNNYLYFKKYHPATTFINMYGPTEATFACTIHQVSDSDIEAYKTLPIGRPFNKTDIMILDGLNKTDEVGEICISGPSLAAGYLNNPTQTKKVFTEYEGTKIYRTGDLGYFKDDLLFFSGRVDSQIKHKGFRIELGEIENAITKLAYIDEGVVLYDSAKKQIMMFYSGIPNLELDIRNDLKEVLQDYMIPDLIKYFKTIPKNRNGKIDRKKLKEGE